MSVEFGPIVEFYTVEQAVTGTLRTWLDTYLSEVERQSSNWAPRQIARPKTWSVTGAYHDITGGHLPAVQVESPGMADDPEPGADQTVSAWWTVTVAIVIKNKSRDLARRELSAYEAAVRTLLYQRGGFDGFAVGTVIGRTSHDLIPQDRDRTLVGCKIPARVLVDAVNKTGGGPPSPDDAVPTPPPVTSPADPLHTSTHVNVNGPGGI